MLVLWGTKQGAESWQEDIITTNPALIDDARRWALANGFRNLRVVDMADGTTPDFAGTVKL